LSAEDQACYSKGQAWYPQIAGPDGERRQRASSPVECQQLCVGFSECEYFSYWPRSYNCFFASAGATQKAKRNSIDGPSNCTESSDSFLLADEFGSENNHAASREIADDAEDEQSERAGSESKVDIVWNALSAEDQACYSKGQAWYPQIAGPDGERRQRASSPVECQQLCVGFEACEHFSFWPRSYNCFLSSATATQRAKRNAIDGPSNCTDSFLS